MRVETLGRHGDFETNDDDECYYALLQWDETGGIVKAGEWDSCG